MSEYSVTIPWGQEKQVYTETFNNREMFLGAIGATPDGRIFRWCYSGGAIGAGERVEASPAVANDDQDLVVAANGAVGDVTLSLTVAAAITVGLYNDGYVITNDGAGEGHIYAIKSHPVVASGTLVLTLREPLREAITTATTLVGLVKNPYKDVIIGTAGAAAAAVVGVAPTEVADNTYFWAQESGVGCVLAEDSTMAIGDSIQAGVNVAGAFQLHDVSVDTEDVKSMGQCLHAVPNAGDSVAVMLRI